MTLQEEFLKTRGKPVKVGQASVIQMDRIRLVSGHVIIRFISSNSKLVGGVALKPPNGYVVLPDNEKVKLLYTWNEVGLPDTASYEVYCPDGELRIWNIYRIHHKSGLVTEDYFTGNAGMIVTKNSRHKRTYKCSDSLGDFDPLNLVFEVEWTATRTEQNEMA